MADVLVVGAGICGASAAHFLSQRGLDVLVLDRDGVSEATTGRGEGNVLVSDKLPGVEREMTVIGRELWHELGARFPAARVTRKGALLLDHPDGAPADELEPALAPGVQMRARARRPPGGSRGPGAGHAGAAGGADRVRRWWPWTERA